MDVFNPEKQVFHRRMRGSIWNDLQDPFSFEKRNDKLLSLIICKKYFSIMNLKEK